MRNIYKLLATLTIWVMICVCISYAQDSTQVVTDTAITVIDSTGNTSVSELPPVDDWFAKGVPVIIGALTIIFGYFSRWVPILNKIPKTKYRVFAFAIIAIAIAFVSGYKHAAELLFAYTGSTSLYELLFSEWFGSSWHVQQKIQGK